MSIVQGCVLRIFVLILPLILCVNGIREIPTFVDALLPFLFGSVTLRAIFIGLIALITLILITGVLYTKFLVVEDNAPLWGLLIAYAIFAFWAESFSQNYQLPYRCQWVLVVFSVEAANSGQPFTANGIERYIENSEEKSLREMGDIEGYWQLRETLGDPFASTALGIVRNEGEVGMCANYILDATARLYGIEYNQRNVNVRMMNAHAEALIIDTDGQVGILNARQIAHYHHQVFNQMGLPNHTFGGTPFFGSLMETYITSLLWWCRSCD